MRIHAPVGVRWSDLDAYGHVNNATMLSLLEEARVHGFWSTADESDDAARVFTGGAESNTYTLIARQEIEYLAPIPHLRDALDIEMWVGKLGGASFDICYEVYSPIGVRPRVLFARATTVIVLVDRDTQRPRKISETERASLKQYLEAPIDYAHRSK